MRLEADGDDARARSSLRKKQLSDESAKTFFARALNLTKCATF